MIATDLKENYLLYENMAVWEINGLEDFLKSHNKLHEIFEKEYGFPFSERSTPPHEFSDPDIVAINRLLDYFDDKHFFVFSYNDARHNELKSLQDKKIIRFGMDIHVINPGRIYILEMDKTKDMKRYDN
jgi:hypothetical protein